MFAVLLLAAAFSITGAAAAQASPVAVTAFPGVPDCKTAPTPAVPGRGFAGWLAPPVHNAVVPPDPKPADFYAIYGWSSFGWSAYDQGCTSSATGGATSIATNAGGFIANLIQTWNLAQGAIASTLLDASLHPTWLAALDPLIERAIAILAPVFTQWAPIAVALTGLLILWMSYRWALRRVFVALGGAVVIISATLSIMTWPVAAGHLFDDGIGSAAGIAAQTTTAGSSQTDPAVASIGAIYSSVYYSQWLNGELGCTPETCAVAQKYGARLWDATHYTLAEATTIKAGGDAAKKITDEKGKAFTDAAGKVHDEDQSAYDVLKGEDGMQRLAAAGLTTVGGCAAMLFLMVACLLLIFAFLAGRVLVMVIPLIGAIGIFPKTRGVFTGALATAGWAVLNGVAFFIGAMVDLLVVGTILDPATPLPGPLRLILCAVVQVVLWRVLKPHRKLPKSRMKFGEHSSREPWDREGTRSLLKDAVGVGIGVAAGGFAGAGAAAKAAGHQSDEPTTGPVRAEMWAERSRPEPAGAVEAPRAEARALPVDPSPDHATGEWSHGNAPEGLRETPQDESGAYGIYRPSSPTEAPRDTADA